MGEKRVHNASDSIAGGAIPARQTRGRHATEITQFSGSEGPVPPVIVSSGEARVEQQHPSTAVEHLRERPELSNPKTTHVLLLVSG